MSVNASAGLLAKASMDWANPSGLGPAGNVREIGAAGGNERNGNCGAKHNDCVRIVHARRKFVDAETTSPREAHEAVARIRQLYAVEHEGKDLDGPARALLRQEKSIPLLAALKEWLDHAVVAALPKSPLGEAVTYTRNLWSALNVYVRDGDLAIDNNTAERAVKPYAIGRKNWLFFGSDRGGRTLATLSSFTATCLQFQINPWTWLRDTLTHLPITSADQLATLLPTPATK